MGDIFNGWCGVVSSPLEEQIARIRGVRVEKAR